VVGFLKKLALDDIKKNNVTGATKVQGLHLTFVRKGYELGC
jgi:hypothetical protein